MNIREREGERERGREGEDYRGTFSRLLETLKRSSASG